MVIAVNGWMNHPSGFALDGRPAPSTCTRSPRSSRTATSGTSSCTCTSPATSSPGFLIASVVRVGAAARARARGTTGSALVDPAHRRRARRADPGPRRRLGRARRRQDAAGQARRARGSGATTEQGAPEHLLGWYDGQRGQVRHPDPEAALAARVPRPERDRARVSTRYRPNDRPPVNVVRFAFQTMVGIGTLFALLGVVYLALWFRLRRLPRSTLVLPRRRGRRPALGRRADRRLDHDRGRAPAVGRLRRDAHLRRPSPARAGIPVGYATLALVYAALAVAVGWLLRRLARAPLEPATPPAGAARDAR